jgi:cytochrome c5
MRKFTIVAILAVLAFSCSKKTTPTKSEIATPAPPIPTEQPTPADNIPPAMVTSGKTLFNDKCGKCHAYKKPELYVADKWVGIMNKMAPKARLTDDQKKDVLAYVQYHAKK